MIAVVDYGMGNLRSVTKALELYTDDVEVVRNPGQLDNASGVVLPGDGAFAMAMDNLDRDGWIKPLTAYIRANRPFLGICLGYQLLFSTSEEFGNSEGLDIIKGEVKRFPHGDLKVPHMGWNQVDFIGKSPYLVGIENMTHFYFIHSYYPEVHDTEWVVGTTDYGISFPAIVGKGRVMATQFHPEKSHRAGLRIIENFVGLL